MGPVAGCDAWEAAARMWRNAQRLLPEDVESSPDRKVRVPFDAKQCTGVPLYDFVPIHLIDIEIGEPLIVVNAPNVEANLALALVRLHGVPLGQVSLPLSAGRIEPEDYAPMIWSQLREQITQHLEEDGLPVCSHVPVTGLCAAHVPRCVTERELFKAEAGGASIVVCTRNRTESLERTLTHLLDQEYPTFEIIVVDNAPSDNRTAELLAALSEDEPRLRYVLETRTGLSVARNRGLAEAGYDRVAYIDDDEIPDPRWLLELMRGFEAATHVGAVSGPILPLALETFAQEWFEEFGGHSKGRGFVQGIFDVASHARQSPLFPAPPFGAGGNMAFRRDVLRQLGGFDESLGAGTIVRGAEDTAAFYDVMRAGWTVVYQPGAIARHEHYRTSEAFRSQLYGYGVGITAFYLRAVLKDPRVIGELSSIAPRAVRYLLSGGSSRVSGRSSSFPPAAGHAQIRGMLFGPFALLASRFRNIYRNRR